MLKSFWLLFMSLQLFCSAGWAERDKCNYSLPTNNRTSLCAGRSLPSDEVRGLRSQRIFCTGNVDHYVRRPQIIVDYDKWTNMVSLGEKDPSQKQKAFEHRRKTQADIEWKGRVPYNVVEEWQWIECVREQNGSECGYHEECHTESYTTTSTSCDSENNCHDTTSHHTREVCNDVANTCRFDVTRTEQAHCSTESINYTARFYRDPEWNPENKNYDDIIPNKYDLLPGEVEDIQVFSMQGSGSRVVPNLVVGDQWNNYMPQWKGSAVNATCRQNTNYDLDLTIHTSGRLVKKSPNAFNWPISWDGKKLPDPFDWSDDGTDVTKAKPVAIKLTDSSASLVHLMSHQSQEVARREEAKEDVGLGANADGMKKGHLKETGFYKNTQLRVHLVEDRWYGISAFSPAFVIPDISGVQTSNYLNSRIQDIKNSEYWYVPLNDSDAQYNVYRRDNFVARFLGTTKKGLKPGQRYIFNLSMYQKGVKYYTQSCEDGQTAGCSNDVFSTPMEFPFWTSPSYDGRSAMEVFFQSTLTDYLHRKKRDRNTSEPGGDSK